MRAYIDQIKSIVIEIRVNDYSGIVINSDGVKIFKAAGQLVEAKRGRVRVILKQFELFKNLLFKVRMLRQKLFITPRK